ncbi:MAG TPA: MerR family transcriptional regulator [Firmicutes bacterium]|nr:MerR family transcriptional regulator [Bacillota bacterium]
MEKKYFSIGEAAEQVHMTSETLRHYDRIGLVKPSKIDARTRYRYYSAEDIVRLHTIHALQQMDLPLQEIKRVLAYDDLEKIIAFLKQAEQKADEKIASLRQSKAKIQLARADYEKKLHGWQAPEGIFTKEFPKRVIMLADPVEKITADDLWSYQRRFYQRLSQEQKKQFAFEDLAGVYRDGSAARYFALCTRYGEIDGLKTLPAGVYLCADCTEESRRETLEKLLDIVKTEYHVTPDFSLQLVVISGIIQWRYQLQVYTGV